MKRLVNFVWSVLAVCFGILLAIFVMAASCADFE